uniref:Putative secreted protein n=1 Tax=Amblyomma triste TaxID=251400 RepID=A0A023G2A7_AMBTT
MANMRISVVAFVCLCMVALAYAQGGSLGRPAKGQGGNRPKPNPKHKAGGASGYQRLDESPTSGRRSSPQGRRPESGHPRPNSPQGQNLQNRRARRPSSPTSEGILDAHPGAPGGYQLLEDDFGRPRPLGSPDLHAKRYSGRD